MRFNQSILQRKDSSKKTQYCCLAIGSRDKSISIWLTTFKRPLAVIKDLFGDSVLDLSWGKIKDQTILLACSTDGTIAALLLSEDEIGKTLSAEDKVICRIKFLISMTKQRKRKLKSFLIKTVSTFYSTVFRVST